MRHLGRRDFWLLAAFSACVGEPLDLGYNNVALTTTPSTPIVVEQDGTQHTIMVHANLSGAETLENLGIELSWCQFGGPFPCPEAQVLPLQALPSGALAVMPSGGSFAPPTYRPSGPHDWTIVFSANPDTPPPAGTYEMTVTATSGQRPLVSSLIEVDVAVVATVTLDQTASQGVQGHLQESMGTSFQPADWQYQFFSRGGQPVGQADGGADGQASDATDGGADGQANGATDGDADGQADDAIDGDADGQANGATDGSADGQANGATDGSADGQANGAADGGPQALLTQLAPDHILIQLMNGGAIPLMRWVPDAPSAADWSFDELDALVQPVLAAASSIPAQVELQIATIPAPIATAGNAAFATYCEDLVHYYNDPYGFKWAGKTFRSPSGIHIPWWGILADWNGGASPMSPDAYATLYNAVVPGMYAVDPAIHFSAFEFAVFPSGSGQPQADLPTFLAQVMAPVDAISLHLYGTGVPPGDKNAATDANLFAAVPKFVPDLNPILSAVQGSTTQVWVTQNNVNSNAPSTNGVNSNDVTTPFTNDVRGTQPFFAAWRPYVFSILGKAGNQALNHWEFTAGSCAPDGGSTYCATPPPDSGIDAASLDTDEQNAEVNYTTLERYVSYWVDQALGLMFPSKPAPGPELLNVSSSEANVPGMNPPSVEVLATENVNVDGSIVVMVVDIAPENPMITNNGKGQPRTVIVDLSSLLSPLPAQTFSQGSTLTIDGATSPDGPSTAVLADLPAAANGYRVQLPLPGYGVTFLKLSP